VRLCGLRWGPRKVSGKGIALSARNTHERYGWVSQWLHWLMALAIFALYGLGLWIDELTYNDPLYNTIPHIHESIGIIVLAALVFRFAWRIGDAEPRDDDLKPWERKAAKVMHWGFYPLILAIMISGYLISTADGRAISVFGWFDVPATLTGKNQEDLAGEVHEILADIVIIAAALHAAAALKHHFMDGGQSLRRMLPAAKPDTPSTTDPHGG